jgi:outer membrane protein assembly factor BamD
MAAFTQYLQNEYDDAIQSLDRFIALHPGNPDAPYAFYLRALCYYERITDVERDQQMTENALKGMEEVVRRFPDSKYGKDAAHKIILARDHLAGKEMEIGRYYQNEGEYLAAINRFERVIELYDRTTHVPEALHRLVESNLALGLIDEARKNAAVLGYNYPHSQWYRDSYALIEKFDKSAIASNPTGPARTTDRAKTPAKPLPQPGPSSSSFLDRAWDWLF